MVTGNILMTDTPQLAQYFRRNPRKSELSIHIINYIRVCKGLQLKSKLQHNGIDRSMVAPPPVLSHSSILYSAYQKCC